MLHIYIIIFIIGCSLGSFYNVVGMRLLKNQSIVQPGSHCPNCKHILKWYELIPVFSYILLKGKCHYCHLKISLIYPAIELLVGTLFCFSFYLFGFSFNFLTAVVIVSLIAIIYITDFKDFTIFDEVLISSGVALITIKLIDSGLMSTIYSIIDGLVMFIIFYLIKLLGDKIFNQESLGGGDIKLSLIIGFVLGIKLGLITIVFSSFLAFPFALYITFTKKTKEVPFGPFLVTALFILFCQFDFFSALINNYIMGR